MSEIANAIYCHVTSNYVQREGAPCSPEYLIWAICNIWNVAPSWCLVTGGYEWVVGWVALVGFTSLWRHTMEVSEPELQTIPEGCTCHLKDWVIITFVTDWRGSAIDAVRMLPSLLINDRIYTEFLLASPYAGGLSGSIYGKTVWCDQLVCFTAALSR